jgi:thiol-disulfide isomerase/thioredoxin
MLARFFSCLLPVAAAAAAACAAGDRPRLARGAVAPDFALPGADGKTHSLRDYADREALVVVFTGNSCPASQLYESRISRLAHDYGNRGVAVVAINPNKPSLLQAEDFAYSDVGESLPDMQSRAAHRRLGYDYLSDGETQSVAKHFGVVSTPHVFVFDRARTLQYQGRIDDNLKENAVASSDARAAIDAVLAGRTPAVERTKVAGCAVQGLGADEQPIVKTAAEPQVPLSMAGASELQQLRKNPTGKMLMVNFWATWCAPCAAEFPDLEATYRMYKGRQLEFVTVSVNDPAERAAVMDFLREHRATHDNRLFATSDVYGLQAAFDPQMPAAVPFTLVLAPNGDVVYQELGELTVLKLRRAILANLPEDASYPGLRAYWANP